MRYLDDLDEIEGMLIRAVRSEGNIHNADTRELGLVVDMIKDIAEAKKCTLEACYYESRSDEGMRLGYSRSRRGYSDGGSGNSGRRGYTDRYELLEGLRDTIRTGDKAEKDRMMQEIRSIIGEG